MVTYEELLLVRVDNIVVGTILDDAGGVYYLPKGYKKDATTKIYPTVAWCQHALEGQV